MNHSVAGHQPSAGGSPTAELSSVDLRSGPASLISLRAGSVAVSLLSYGAAIVGYEAPDRHGRPANCVLTLADRADLVDDSLNPHLGGIVGRYANRIAGASFTLDGVTHRLEANEGPNTLHGGSAGWDRRSWGVAGVHADAEQARTTMVLSDPDGAGGFPGRMEVAAGYSLRADGTLTLELECTPDRPTVVAPTSHVYWNLAGSGTVADHLLSVRAGSVLEPGPGQIPTGAMVPVDGGPWDLRQPVRLGDRLDRPELEEFGGYDHTLLVDAETDGERTPPLVARLADPASGRTSRCAAINRPCTSTPATTSAGSPGSTGRSAPRRCLPGGRRRPQRPQPDRPDRAGRVDPGGRRLRPGERRRWITSWRIA
ncbi:MAG: aldose epimerase family protein [Microthrixaceae bacterium]